MAMEKRASTAQHGTYITTTTQHSTSQHSLAPKDNTCHHRTHIADQIEGVVLSNRCIDDAAKLGLRGLGDALLATRPGTYRARMQTRGVHYYLLGEGQVGGV